MLCQPPPTDRNGVWINDIYDSNGDSCYDKIEIVDDDIVDNYLNGYCDAKCILYESPSEVLDFEGDYDVIINVSNVTVSQPSQYPLSLFLQYGSNIIQKSDNIAVVSWVEPPNDELFTQLPISVDYESCTIETVAQDTASVSRKLLESR